MQITTLKHKQLFYQLTFLLGFSFLIDTYSIGQKTYEYNLDLLNQNTRVIHKTIDISDLNLHEFMAISLVIEGTNLNKNTIQGSFTTTKSYIMNATHEDDDLAHRYVSELYFVPRVEADHINIQIDLGAENIHITNLTGKLRIFIPEKSKSAQKPIINPVLTDQCNCAMLPYIPREVWGAAFHLGHDIYKPPAVYTKVTHLIIHHSAGTNFSNDWSGVVAAYFDYHVNSNGWQDIGYNWLIDPYGVLYEGRGGGDNVQGAHMCGYNKNSMAVCMLGNFEVALPTDTMMQVLKQILSYKACKENIDPLGDSDIVSWPGHMFNISGHKDGCSPNYTSCPGKFLHEKLDYIRHTTEDYIHTSCDTTSTTMDTDDKIGIIYPNPASLTLCGIENLISIRNILGIEISSSNFKLNDSCLDITDLLPGIYYLTTLNSGRLKTIPFIKE